MTLQEFITVKLREAMAGALKDVQDELTAIAEAGGEKAHGGVWGDVGTLTGILHSLSGPLEVLIGLAVPPLGVLEAAEAAGGDGGRAFGIGWWLGSEAFQALRPAMLPLEHMTADLLQTEIFDPATAAELEAQGIIDNAYGRSEAAGGNLSGEHYDKLVESALERPELAQTLQLWNRGLVGEADVDAALTHHKVPAFWHGPLKMLRRNLLSPADLALNNLRGEMSEEDAQVYAAVLGIIPDDFKVLVQNTGEPPGPEELMEALRRGFIDKQRFDRGIRQSRVRDEWIDVEYALRQSPMSTSDAVRAVIEHYLTEDEGKHIAQQNGLIPEHWEPLMLSWGRPLSHEQMMSLFHRGEATLEQVQQAFRESDMKDKYFDLSVKLGETLVPQRQVTTMLQHGVITKQQAHDMLRKLGYDDASATALIDLGAAEHKTSLHTLTKADILTSYNDALMSKEEAHNHLTHLGYTDGDARELLDLADVKTRTASLKATQRTIEASLKAHHLTQQQAINQLTAAGMLHEQASGLVDQWMQQRGAPTRSLTEAQILKLAETGLMTPDDCRTRLIAYGLVKQDADLLLYLHGIVKPPDSLLAAVANGGSMLGGRPDLPGTPGAAPF